ncbi:VP5 [CHeRI orbivirus 2-1]|nr:VP5 [CHeRI orbivirus 2-1]
MGKFTAALSRLGRGIKNVATSETTKKVMMGIGSAAAKVLESEIGQKVVSGVIQGAAEAVVTESDAGTAIKRAIIGNFVNIHSPPVDPLNPTEQMLSAKVDSLQREMTHMEGIERFDALVDRKLESDIEHIKSILKKDTAVTREEENQVKTLESAINMLTEISEHEMQGLRDLNDALLKESRARNRDENRMIEAMKSNFTSMMNAVKTEKDALIDEALEQTLDIGGEIAEHVAAEVPFVGESIASGMATARGVQQIYKLTKTINRVTGIDLTHAEMPAVSPTLAETLLTTEQVNDAALQRVVAAKIKHVDEIIKEIEHINESVVTELKKKAAEEGVKAGNPATTIHHTIRSTYHVPTYRRPGVHVYTAPYDSDYVVIFLIVAPYSVHRACMIGIDLKIDFVFFQDLSHGGTKVHKGVRIGGYPNFRNACKEFFKDSAKHASSTRIHSERMLRGIGSEPLYVTSLPYPYSYAQTRRQAEIFCKTPEVQRHILRGPLNMQRKSVLNAILHGVTLISSGRSRGVQQGRIHKSQSGILS